MRKTLLSILMMGFAVVSSKAQQSSGTKPQLVDSLA